MSVPDPHRTGPAPLSGVLVVDLTRVLSGPFCTMQLGDLGARVIKIEQPGRGDETRAWGPPFLGGESAYFLSINRNKESVAIDLKREEGRAAVERLIGRADVVVDNFRPGTLERLGLGSADLLARHPRLVVASITGFGHEGPSRDRPGYDAIVQAEAGLMSLTGPADGPPYRLGVPIADLAAGLYAAQAILAALIARERSGRGQRVDVSMLDATASLLTYQAALAWATGTSRKRMGNRHPTIVPYDTFPAADGEFLLAVGNDAQWQRFCRVAGLEVLASDERFATNPARVANHDALRPLLETRLRQEPRDVWLARLGAAGVPCAAVRDVGDVLTDADLAARGMIVTQQHPSAGEVQSLGIPARLHATPGELRSPPPLLGQHTRAVLEELGYSADRIAALEANGTVECRS